MSKDLVPSTFPSFINRKLDALGSDPKKADLDAIRVLLDIDQEERVLSQEEVQDWKRSVKKVLEDQKKYKEEIKKNEEKGKGSIHFCLFFTLPIFLCVYLTESLGETTPYFFMRLFLRWPINFVAVATYFFYLEYLQKAPKPKKSENEDDWEDSMTSTELQSKQKALLDRWEKIEKEEDAASLSLNRMIFVACFLNVLYFGLRLVAVLVLLADHSYVLYGSSCKNDVLQALISLELIFSIVFIYIFVSHLNTFPKAPKVQKKTV